MERDRGSRIKSRTKLTAVTNSMNFTEDSVLNPISAV
jgi:hypothetical protein